MSKQQQMQDILKDTVDYYREDPKGRRAVDHNGDCQYTTVSGNHCAIGRYMKPEYQTTEFDENQGVGVHGLSCDIDHYLISKVLGLDEMFWRDLQDMHDKMLHWEAWSMEVDGLREYKLTDEGKEYYVKMQDRIAEGRYDD